MIIEGRFINLDRATGRRTHMEAEAARTGLPLSRQEATDGRAMSPETYERWHPKAGGMHRLSPLEVACFLSHRAAWAEIAEGAAPYGAVFEDDLTFADDAANNLTRDDWIPAGADLIKIETTARKAMLAPPFLDQPNGRMLARLTSRHLGAGGYVLSRDFARRLLAATDPIAVPVDYALFSEPLAAVPGASLWQLSPAICVQQVRTSEQFLPKDAEWSGLDAARRGIKRTGLAKIWREVTRPFADIGSEAAHLVHALSSGRRWLRIRFRR